MVKCFKKYLYIASQQFAFELMLLKWYLIPVLFVYFSTVLCSDLELTVKAKFALSNPVSSNRHRFSISKVLVTRSYLTLCNPMDCSPPGFSVHGILQERIPFSRGSSRLRDRTQVSCITGRFFTIWVMTRIKECVLCLWTFHTRLCWAPGGGGHQGKETDGALAPQFHLKWLNSHLFYIVDPCFSEMRVWIDNDEIRGLKMTAIETWGVCDFCSLFVGWIVSAIPHMLHNDSLTWEDSASDSGQLQAWPGGIGQGRLRGRMGAWLALVLLPDRSAQVVPHSILISPCRNCLRTSFCTRPWASVWWTGEPLGGAPWWALTPSTAWNSFCVNPGSPSASPHRWTEPKLRKVGRF